MNIIMNIIQLLLTGGSTQGLRFLLFVLNSDDIDDWTTLLGGCQDYGPFLGPYYIAAPINYLGCPERDLNFDNYPFG